MYGPGPTDHEYEMKELSIKMDRMMVALDMFVKSQSAQAVGVTKGNVGPPRSPNRRKDGPYCFKCRTCGHLKYECPKSVKHSHDNRANATGKSEN